MGVGRRRRAARPVRPRRVRLRRHLRHARPAAWPTPATGCVSLGPARPRRLRSTPTSTPGTPTSATPLAVLDSIGARRAPRASATPRAGRSCSSWPTPCRTGCSHLINLDGLPVGAVVARRARPPPHPHAQRRARRLARPPPRGRRQGAPARHHRRAGRAARPHEPPPRPRVAALPRADRRLRAAPTAGAGRSTPPCAWAGSARGAPSGRWPACRRSACPCCACSASRSRSWAGAPSPRTSSPNLPAGARFVPLDGVGHFVHIEKPARRGRPRPGVLVVSTDRPDRPRASPTCSVRARPAPAARRRRVARSCSCTASASARPTTCPGVRRRRGPGRCCALDFTGHGAIEPVPAGGGYTAEILMADVDAALAHLGACTVVGRGLGAYVALLIAGARPELVRGAVLADGPGLAGGGPSPHSPSVIGRRGTAAGSDRRRPPDPFALVELARDVRPADYATTYAAPGAPVLGPRHTRRRRRGGPAAVARGRGRRARRGRACRPSPARPSPADRRRRLGAVTAPTGLPTDLTARAVRRRGRPRTRRGPGGRGRRGR